MYCAADLHGKGIILLGGVLFPGEESLNGWKQKTLRQNIPQYVSAFEISEPAF